MNVLLLKNSVTSSHSSYSSPAAAQLTKQCSSQGWQAQSLRLWALMQRPCLAQQSSRRRHACVAAESQPSLQQKPERPAPKQEQRASNGAATAAPAKWVKLFCSLTSALGCILHRPPCACSTARPAVRHHSICAGCCHCSAPQAHLPALQAISELISLLCALTSVGALLQANTGCDSTVSARAGQEDA